MKTVVGIILFLGLFTKINSEKFSCEGRASGYYADVDAGCQVYHMCDGLGRQFSYSCPNTTLFQQRMLICDHWYMVSCSKSESDYNANLLIGQRDKPFVEDSSEHPYHRTPRPDFLEQPFSEGSQDDELRQGRAQRVSSDLNIVGIATADDSEDENGKRKNFTTDRPQYFLPSRWSTQYNKDYTTPLPFRRTNNNNNFNPQKFNNDKNIPNNFKPSFTPERQVPQNINLNPLPPKPVVKPIPHVIPQNRVNITNRQDSSFIPDSLNQETVSPSTLALPPFVPKQPQIITQPIPLPKNVFTTVKPETSTRNSVRFSTPVLELSTNLPEVPKPSIYYQPPKISVINREILTAVNIRMFHQMIPEPSRELLPPSVTNNEDNSRTTQNALSINPVISSPSATKNVNKKQTQEQSQSQNTPQVTSPSQSRTTGPVQNQFSENHWKELRQMFFIPEYDFPLDTGHRASYDGGVSSFQVNSAPPNPEARRADSRTSNQQQGATRAVNSECPKCDPAFLAPGTCKPCVMIR